MKVTEPRRISVNYLYEEARLNTFSGKWKTPKGFKHCTPSNFAAAGFFYFGSSSSPDCVKCFACCKELSDWEKDDDPWQEHIKRGENCMFVQLKVKPVVTVEDILRLCLQVQKNIYIEYNEASKKTLEDNYNLIMEQKKD